MRLEQLEFVIEVARVGSINKAAENLYISQPQLSTSIKQLENELNIKIFTRDSKGVVLTPAGKELLRISLEVNKSLVKIRNICHQYGTYIEPLSLNISSIPSYAVIDLFQQFIKVDKNAGNKFTLRETPDRMEIIDRVAKHQSDLGIIYMSTIDEKETLAALRSKNLQFIEICREPIHVYVGKNSPLWSKDSITITDCRNQLIAINTSAQKDYEAIIKYCNLEDSKTVSFQDIRSLMHFISNSQGLSFGLKLANISNHYVASRLLKFIPFSDLDVSMKLGWIKPVDTTLSSVALSFVSVLEEFYSKQS